MNKKALSSLGLKWNPFSRELPTEALWKTPRIESFCARIESSHLREGGFALITGEPGTGKSVALRLLSEQLAASREIIVGELKQKRCTMADFYREMGDLFGIELKPHNRWHGFKSLRERWQHHIDSTLARPVLLVDEAQEVSPVVLSELRLLSSIHFDSRVILSVVFAGDHRFTDMLRQPALLPLGSRIRTRLVLEPAAREELLAYLKHLITAAGNARLMTAELMNTLCDHALGNLRVLTNMGAELLEAAAQTDCAQLDEKLYLEVFTPNAKSSGTARAKVAAKT